MRKSTSSINVDIELHARARAAVRIVSRATNRRYTLAQFVREAFIGQLAVLSRDYNNGREIRPDDERLDPGPVSRSGRTVTTTPTERTADR